MHDEFERRVHAAAIAGWSVLLAATGLLTFSWLVYLAAMASHPEWLMRLWGPDVTWEYVENRTASAMSRLPSRDGAQWHRGEIFETHRPTGEQGNCQAVAKMNRPPPRRPIRRLGLVHQALAELIELANRPQARELVAHRSSAPDKPRSMAACALVGLPFSTSATGNFCLSACVRSCTSRSSCTYRRSSTRTTCGSNDFPIPSRAAPSPRPEAAPDGIAGPRPSHPKNRPPPESAPQSESVLLPVPADTRSR